MQAMPPGFGALIEGVTTLQCVTRRVRMTTMTILGAPGEVLLAAGEEAYVGREGQEWAVELEFADDWGEDEAANELWAAVSTRLRRSSHATHRPHAVSICRKYSSVGMLLLKRLYTHANQPKPATMKRYHWENSVRRNSQSTVTRRT